MSSSPSSSSSSSPLSRRVAASLTKRATSERSVALALFPLDTIKRYLNTHPLVVNMRVDSSEVYSALLKLHSYKLASSSTEHDAPPPPPPPKPVPPNCPECRQGYKVIDEQAGSEVCDRCGLVVSTQLNFVPEYETQLDANPRTRRPTQSVCVNWLRKKVDAMAAADDSTRERRSYLFELEHWNHYTNHTPDDIASVAHTLKTWRTHYPSDVRIAAGLLHVLLESYFPVEEVVRTSLKSGRPLSEVTTTTPQAEFPCAECSKRCFDVRSARYHCRNPYTKRLKGQGV